MALLGPYLAACALLAVAGAAKLARPQDTARALVSVTPWGMAVVRPAVRLVAGGELVLALAALCAPSPVPAVGVALSYGAFTVFVLAARRRGGPLSSCGCFGRADTPATVLHAVVDATLAACALVVAVALAGGGGPAAIRSVPGALVDQPGHGVPLVLAAAVGAWLAGHVLSTLPRTRAASGHHGGPQ